MSQRESKMILVVGHPRCGTAFMADVFQQLGLDVQHESVGKHGCSSWLMAVPERGCFAWTDCTRESYCWQIVLHCVRDPWQALASILHTELWATDKEPVGIHQSYRRDSTQFRRRFVDIPEDAPPLEQAVRSFLGWNRLIRQQLPESRVVRVEHVREDLASKLPALRSYLPLIQDTEAKNRRSHADLTAQEWATLTPSTLAELDSWCQQHGYESVSSRLALPP